MGLTKLDIAEREIVTAVRLLFGGGDPIAVCLLASAAREITSRLCAKRGVEAFLDLHPHQNKADLHRLANRYSNFFKHANEDPDALLLDFIESEVDSVLYLAVTDFGSLCGGMPVEAQAFQTWFAARLDPKGVGEYFVTNVLIGIDTYPRSKQLELGQLFLEWCLQKPEFRMTYSTK